MTHLNPFEHEAPQPLTEDLIDHILARYHATHRRDLAEAIELASRVERVHAMSDACPHGLTDLLVLISDDLEDHQQKEEVVLFPMMLSGAASSLSGPLARMRLDHDDLAGQMESLRTLTKGFVAPGDACGIWRALYAVCARIDADLKAHVELENEILFPRFADNPDA